MLVIRKNLRRIIDYLAYSEVDESKSLMRIGLLSAIILYSFFAITDYFVLPINYKIAWFIRGVIVLGAMYFLFTIDFWLKNILKFKYILAVIVGLTQLSIALIQYISVPGEYALWYYYVGYILILFYAALVFKLSVFIVFLNIILSVFLFNVVFYLKIGEFSEFLAMNENFRFVANFHLIFASVLIVIGTVNLTVYSKDLNSSKKALIIEKEFLVKANMKAQESDRLKAMFLSNLSHELRTPMNSIIGFSELISSPDYNGDDLKKYVSIIHDKSYDLLHIIDNLIDLSLINAGQLSLYRNKFNLNDLFENIINEFKTDTKYHEVFKNVKILFRKGLAEKEDSIFCDEKRLKQILRNLISNSLKFTPIGEIIVGYEIEDNKIIYHVNDTGIGFSNEVLDDIYNIFVKGEEKSRNLYGGIGAGLNMVKKLLEIMQGEIDIKSERGKGTQVRFSLPFNPAQNSESK